MMFYKRDSDGSILRGTTVYGPGFTLTRSTDEPADGWSWSETPEQAKAALRATDLEMIYLFGDLTPEKLFDLAKEQITKDREEAKPALEKVKS